MSLAMGCGESGRATDRDAGWGEVGQDAAARADAGDRRDGGPSGRIDGAVQVDAGFTLVDADLPNDGGTPDAGLATHDASALRDASVPSDAFVPCTTSLACDDGNECTSDTCGASGRCEHAAIEHTCDDGLYCNGADHCAAGSCSMHDGDPCAGGAECASHCNEGARSCLATAGSACTTDGNPCTDDVCDGTGACTHPANVAPCDDGVFCNGADHCAAGSCSTHAGDPCPGGAECRTTCREDGDSCLSPAGFACTDVTPADCWESACDGAGSCEAHASAAFVGATCGAATVGTCDAAMTCRPPIPFSYSPSNFVPSSLPVPAGVGVYIDCDAVYDATTNTFPTWCGPMPRTISLPQTGGPGVRVLLTSSLVVQPRASLTLQGSYPVLIAVFGDATIEGTVRGDAGAFATCGASHGGAGGSQTFGPAGGGGGGGGGFGGGGASGGVGRTSGAAGSAGASSGNNTLSPLRGGAAAARAARDTAEQAVRAAKAGERCSSRPRVCCASPAS